MKVSILAYTRGALHRAFAAAAALTDRNEQNGADCVIYTIPRLAGEEIPEKADIPLRVIEQGDEDFYRNLFRGSDLLVFVSALQIAVRKIAPYVKDKKKDPAVLCMDERGQFVIAVLSGHIGGANEAAKQLAGKLGAEAVITTATDINHRFSVDAWAARQGFLIDDMKAAKAVSAAILERDIPMLCELPVHRSKTQEYPPGVFGIRPDEERETEFPVGIYIGWRILKPFRETLRLIPPVIHLGIGCRKGVGAAQIENAVEEVFARNGIDLRAVRGVYSIDLKQDEEGLIQFCKSHGWDLTVYSADELLAVPGVFTSSGFVRSVTGVDNVCERAAVKEADTLLIRKTAAEGVTVAAALRHMEASF